MTRYTNVPALSHGEPRPGTKSALRPGHGYEIARALRVGGLTRAELDNAPIGSSIVFERLGRKVAGLKSSHTMWTTRDGWAWSEDIDPATITQLYRAGAR